MKPVILIILAFLALTSCGGTTVDIDTQEEKEVSPTDSAKGSIEQAEILDQEIEPPPLPPDQIEVKEDIEAITKKATTSVVAEEACCENIVALQPCCCDKVLEKYEGFMKADNFEEAMAIDGKDAYYSLCVDQFKDFEGKVIAIQDKYLN